MPFVNFTATEVKLSPLLELSKLASHTPNAKSGLMLERGV
jgi:hypothetical protein